MRKLESRVAGGLAILVGVTASAMLLLGLGFYTRSVAGVASDATRHFLLAATGAVVLPFSWVLLNLVVRRVPVRLLAGITCALVYLVGGAGALFLGRCDVVAARR